MLGGDENPDEVASFCPNRYGFALRGNRDHLKGLRLLLGFTQNCPPFSMSYSLTVRGVPGCIGISSCQVKRRTSMHDKWVPSAEFRKS